MKSPLTLVKKSPDGSLDVEADSVVRDDDSWYSLLCWVGRRPAGTYEVRGAVWHEFDGTNRYPILRIDPFQKMSFEWVSASAAHPYTIQVQPDCTWLAVYVNVYRPEALGPRREQQSRYFQHIMQQAYAYRQPGKADYPGEQLASTIRDIVLQVPVQTFDPRQAKSKTVPEYTMEDLIKKIGHEFKLVKGDN